jgi:hypothetical protein
VQNFHHGWVRKELAQLGEQVPDRQGVD